MANPALVFSAFNDAYTETTTACANKISVGKPTRPATSTGREKVITVAGMEGFRRGLQLEMEDVSVNAAKVIFDARSEGSVANYESSWGQWAS